MAANLGGALITNPNIISSVTADLTGLVSGRDEGYEQPNRVYGYRGPTDEATDLTEMFAAIAIGESLDVSYNGPIPAFRGADVPVE